MMSAQGKLIVAAMLGTFSAGLTMGGFWLSEYEGVRLALQTTCMLAAIILLYYGVRRTADSGSWNSSRRMEGGKWP